MTEAGAYPPDQVITWRTYVLTFDDICRWAGIVLKPGVSIDAELADRSALRLTLKSIDE